MFIIAQGCRILLWPASSGLNLDQYLELNMPLLRNIFINSTANKLRLAEIHFENEFKEIKYMSDEIDWYEIDSKEKLSTFTAKNISTQNNSHAQIVDGNFLLAMPGAIDPHVHFNTPGFEENDDFEHGSTAAAFGGVTTVIDMPCTSIPPVTSVKNLNEKLDALNGRSLVDYALWGGISGNNFENEIDIQKQVNELSEAGVAAFKTYLISGMSAFKDLTLEQMNLAMQYVSKTGKPLGVHAEDKFLVTSRQSEFQDMGINTWEAYCSTRDSKAEEKAIADLISIASSHNIRVHVVHLSSRAGLEQIIKAKTAGLAFTSETCPHYLYFTQTNFNDEEIRNFLKTAPPVKFEYDREALWEGLQNGDLSFVTTDHAGCYIEDGKISDNFWKVYGGIPGVEHRVPFLFSEGFLKGKLTLEQTIKLLSTNAADYFDLRSKGSLEIGKDADIALINLWEGENILAGNMHSKGQFTPFDGMFFNSKVERTYVRGKTVVDKNGKAEENVGFGKFIPINN